MKSFVLSEIARQLKRARKEQGLTQVALGERTGLPQSHISQIESGNVDIRLTNFVEVVSALNLELILTPRQMVPLVKSIMRGDYSGDRPCYQLDGEEEEESDG